MGESEIEESPRLWTGTLSTHTFSRGWTYFKIFTRRRLQQRFNYFYYKFPFEFMDIALGLVSYFFIGKLLGESSPLLAPYGGSFISYIILGMAFNWLLSLSLHNYYQAMKGAYGGSINYQHSVLTRMEWFMLARVPPVSVIGSEILYGYLDAFVRISIYLIVGLAIFGLSLGAANMASVLAIGVLGVLSASGIGLISASMFWLISAGRGPTEPISYSVQILVSLVSGVYYPPEVLPEALHTLSRILPQTSALRAMRLAVLQGTPLGELGSEITHLLLTSAILVGVGLVLLRASIRRARQRAALY